MAKRLSTKPPKAKTRQVPSLEMDGEVVIASIGLPGVIVDETSGPCTTLLKGGKTCSCQRYSEVNPRDPKNPGCRECTHGHSAHNGRRPAGDGVNSIVRNILNNTKHDQVSRGQIPVPFKAAKQESNSGYRWKVGAIQMKHIDDVTELMHRNPIRLTPMK